MVVSVYQGIVEVPLFTQPYNYSPLGLAGIQFNRTSYVPIIFGGSYNLQQSLTGSLLITRADVIMPGVTSPGTSILSRNTIAGSKPAKTVSWFDNYLWWENNTASYTDAMCWTYMSRVPGAYTCPQYPSHVGPVFQNRRQYITPVMPAQVSGNPAAVIGWTDLAFNLTLATFDNRGDYNNNVLTTNDGGSFAGATTTANSRIYGNQAQVTNDNAMYLGKNGAHPVRVMYWRGDGSTPTPAILPLNLDNPTLDAVFQTTNPFTWWSGLIFCLNTNGAGPTGQRNEVVVMNQDFSAYYLIRFVPMDSGAQVAVTNTSTNWQVQIDTDGIVWFTPAATSLSGAIYYSYSRSFIGFPTIYNPQFNPIVLPCYNTCSPVSWS